MSTSKDDFSSLKETVWLYAVVVFLVGLGILLSLYAGRNLRPEAIPAPVVATESPSLQTSPLASTDLTAALKLNATSALSHLFLQLGVILGTAAVLGRVFTRFGQPAVIGEMMAGVILGPSLFGLLAPQGFAFVFAPASLGALRLFSQIGVCFFMFAIGMELNLGQLRHSAHRYLVIGHSSILIPYLGGVLLSIPLFRYYAAPGASFLPFALFIGISMSITAFPVLVRILKDRGLFHSSLGQSATLCAAIADLTAWCVLALVVAIAEAANLRAVGFNLALVGIYVLIMIVLVRPFLARLLRSSLHDGFEPNKDVLAIVLGVVIVSALSTEIIGMHALFGAFLAGIVMPAGGGFRKKLSLRVEHFSSVLLLPLFFAFVGLRTHVGLLSGSRDWLVFLGLIAVATAGKLGGTAVVSRLMKMPWRESFELGVLMNTRGLMELIVLNIGYELGILSLNIFSMLVLMAIATTMMTGPLLDLFRDRTVKVGPAEQ
jgi:Kef-type K+ transport system membrane component KefB